MRRSGYSSRPPSRTLSDVPMINSPAGISAIGAPSFPVDIPARACETEPDSKAMTMSMNADIEKRYIETSRKRDVNHVPTAEERCQGAHLFGKGWDEQEMRDSKPVRYG